MTAMTLTESLQYKTCANLKRRYKFKIMKNTQLVIIGSGPAGYTAAIYASRAQLAPILLAGQESGGQLMLTTEIENFPGIEHGKTGPELMMTMREQSVRFGTTMLDEYATFVDLSKRPFQVWTSLPENFDLKKLRSLSPEEYSKLRADYCQNHPAEINADAIILAMGASTVWLDVPGEAKLIGRGVSSCAVCDAAFFKDKETFVIGGGDSAMEDTLALTKFAKSVTVIHRRDQFRASKIMQERVLHNPKVKVMWNSRVTEVLGEQMVSGIKVATVDPKSQKESTVELPAQGVFVAIGHTPMSWLVADQVALDEKGFVITRRSPTKAGAEVSLAHLDPHGLVQFPTLTSVEGVFAAGDLVDLRYKQAITAAGSGCEAALDAERWL